MFKKQEEKKEDDEYLPSQLEMMRFIYKNVKLNWYYVILANAMFLISSYINIKSSLVLLSIKVVIIDNDLSKIRAYILEYIIYSIFIGLYSQLNSFLSKKLDKPILESINNSITSHLLSLDIQYFEANKVNDLMEIINVGPYYISAQIRYNGFINKFTNYFSSLEKVYFVYCISPRVAISMLVLTIIFGIFQEKIKQYKNQLKKALNNQQQFQNFALGDILNNILVTKSFGQERKEIETLKKLSKDNQDNTKQSQRINTIQFFVISFQQDTIELMIILQIILSRNTSNYTFSAQSLTEIITQIFFFSHFFNLMVQLFQQKNEGYYEQSLITIGKIMKIFEEKPSIPQQIENYNKQQNLKGDILFENVYFEYPVVNDKLAKKNQLLHQKIQKEEQQQQSTSSSSEDPQSDSSQISSNSELGEEVEIKQESQQKQKIKSYAVENVSFQIKQGQFVSFVGKSGSGKSTIAKLLQRVYDPSSGSVIFDQQNAKDISIRQIKQSFGYVCQEPTLLDNDIQYNITYGCHEGEYTQDDLKRVCDISGVSEFVYDKKRFPKGLKTLIGANGIKLSGGQKQRVAIARALLKNPSILILDEATSSLDAESEHTVQKYIDEIVQKENRSMTIIVIAHRLSTIIKSDNIFVMEHGQIKETGSHKVLLEKNGIYKKLINRQISSIQY